MHISHKLIVERGHGGVPALGRWFKQEYTRLRSEGKSALVDRFKPLLDDVACGQCQAAMSAMPELYTLADALSEPVWRLVVDYYAVVAEISWRGNLAAGLDLATSADLQARQLVGADHVLELHLRENLLYAWLNVDEPGYAPDVLAAVDELSIDQMFAALAVRFKLLRAHAIAGCGNPEAGYALLQEALAGIDWPVPYHHRNRGCGLAWVGRLEEAATCHHLAMSGYEEQGMTIEANASRLDLGEALLSLGRLEEGLDMLQAARSSAEHSPNAFQVGKAQGLIGIGLARQGEPGQGASWLLAALERLDGLGWLRTEAEYALAHLRILAQMGTSRASEAWRSSRDRAEQCIGQLKSKDLPSQLLEIEDL